jgi:hypothetical protein
LHWWIGLSSVSEHGNETQWSAGDERFADHRSFRAGLVQRLHSLYSDIPFLGSLVEGDDGVWYSETYDPTKPNVSRSVADSTLITPLIMPLIGKPPPISVLLLNMAPAKLIPMIWHTICYAASIALLRMPVCRTRN